MSSANPKYVISTLTLDSVTWTPILAPFSCNGIGIKSSVDIKLRTDSGDANTQDSLLAGQFELIDPANTQDSSGYIRFPPGAIVAYLQALSGTPTALIRFIR